MDQVSTVSQQVAEVGLLDALRVETGVIVGAALAGLLLVRLLLGWLENKRRVKPFYRHAIILGLTVVALVAATLTLRDPVRDQVLKFLGVLFSAVLAFSSTTLVGNALAGVMLRTQRHFRGGDWVRVGDRLGQVSHRGLFFTTLQDELADLVTLPNIYLATHPVTVVSTPTFISTQVSLGYDVPRGEVDRLLIEAATSAGLEKPFVYVLELGDFSVLYRVSGRLQETGELLTRRSELRCRVLDALHAGGVEIVSPAFMNQRVLTAEERFIPAPSGAPEPAAPAGPAPEAEIFDKGREAKNLEQLEDALVAADKRVAELQAELGQCDSDERRDQLRRDLDKLERGRKGLSEEIRARQAQAGDASPKPG